MRICVTFHTERFDYFSEFPGVDGTDGRCILEAVIAAPASSLAAPGREYAFTDNKRHIRGPGNPNGGRVAPTCLTIVED
jgi:hypothetical protein